MFILQSQCSEKLRGGGRLFCFSSCPPEQEDIMQIGHKITVAAAVILTAVLVLSAVPYAEAADETTTGFDNIGEFFDAVKANNYTYDGNGVTVSWSPTSKCDGTDKGGCLFDEENTKPTGAGNTPNRGQSHNAQYHLFNNSSVDVVISNVNFVYVPGDFKLCINSDWKGEFKGNNVVNAELQFNTTGSVTFVNCTFDQVIVSTYGSTDTTTITNCKFSNVYDAYALKDIYSPNASITGCSFDKCSGGIYFEGNNEKGDITIQNNTFTNMDSYAEAGKENTRGLIQFSAAGNYTNSDIVIEDNKYSGDTPIIRQLNPTITPEILDPATIKNSNSFVGDLFVAGSVSVDDTDQNPDDSGTPGWSDDDEELPPMIRPGASSSEDDSVTIVACAAAAVVAALMAVFLIVSYKKE